MAIDNRKKVKIVNLALVALLLATFIGVAAFPKNAEANTSLPITVVHSFPAQSGCDTFERVMPINLWFMPYAKAHVEAKMCWDGQKAWLNEDKPNCYFTGVKWPYRFDETWCGVWNNGGEQTQPGMNFTVTGSVRGVGDVVTRFGWMRFSVYGDGGAPEFVYGGLS